MSKVNFNCHNGDQQLQLKCCPHFNITRERDPISCWKVGYDILKGHDIWICRSSLHKYKDIQSNVAVNAKLKRKWPFYDLKKISKVLNEKKKHTSLSLPFQHNVSVACHCCFNQHYLIPW